MRQPNQKQITVYVPEFVRVGLGLAISQMYDGKVFDDFPGSCQRCGSRNCVRNGRDDVLFAKLISPKGGFIEVRVLLQNYLCNDCGKPYLSRGPFYEGAIYGAPIVDTALMLSMDSSSYGVERAMMNLGIQVSEDTALDYTRLFAERAKQLAPLIEGQGEGLYAINMLKLLFGVNNAKELKEKLPEMDVSSVSDETYLRKKGALKKFIEELVNSDGKVVPRGLNRDIVVKDGKAAFPDSFTLALSYLPGAEAYASLICTAQSFNQLLADILFRALKGTPFNVTDGSRNYNGVKDRVLDPVHRTRSELKHDPKFREMKKEAEELRKEIGEAKGNGEKEKLAEERLIEKVGEIASYAKGKYQDMLGSTLEDLKAKHPECFDKDGGFNGHVTSNCAEGGNWRMKYAVRVAHARTDTAAGKSILAAIKDSVFTVRGVKVRESIANKLGLFAFGRVMGAMATVARA